MLVGEEGGYDGLGEEAGVGWAEVNTVVTVRGDAGDVDEDDPWAGGGSGAGGGIEGRRAAGEVGAAESGEADPGDGAGAIVPDAMLEIWQANGDGIYAHPEDPRWEQSDAHSFGGFGRCCTGPDGSYSFVTLKPGRVPGADERMQAPHIVMNVFARGLLNRLVTRVYFEDEAVANASDPLLGSIEDVAVRGTMVARAEGLARYRFDVWLQGAGETAFLAV